MRRRTIKKEVNYTAIITWVFILVITISLMYITYEELT